MDLLGSILNSMEKPPSIATHDSKKTQAQKKLIEKQQNEERKILANFKNHIQEKIQHFVQNNRDEKIKFDPMDKVQRSIVHEVADVAGLASFSFGFEEEYRYVMLWKKEFAPSDEELLAYRRGEDWNPVAKLQDASAEDAVSVVSTSKGRIFLPTNNYRNKYKHLIGEDNVCKEDARSTATDRNYGFDDDFERLAKPEGGLVNCSWYASKSCCKRTEVTSVFSNIEPLHSASRSCRNQMNFLMCFFCSPDQQMWFINQKLRVCLKYCSSVYKECFSAGVGEFTFGRAYTNGSTFCEAQNFDIVDGSDCFDYDPDVFDGAMKTYLGTLLCSVSIVFSSATYLLVG